MKTIEVFINEVTKLRFDSSSDAERSEKFSKDIANTFLFWVPFEQCPRNSIMHQGIKAFFIARDESEYNKFVHAFVYVISKYKAEFDIDIKVFAEKLESFSTLREMHSFITNSCFGRLLNESHDSFGLKHWWTVLCRICPCCYREWDQMYYAIHCCC